jgi:PAS domain S-box-containing protein
MFWERSNHLAHNIFEYKELMANYLNKTEKNIFPFGNEKYFSAMADAIPEIFSFIDPNDYTIQFVNRVEEGYHIEEVIGTEIFNYILPEYKDLYKEKIELVKLTGENEVLEIGFRSYRFDDGVSWFKTTISAIKGPDDSLEALLILSEDITKSRQLEIEANNQSERLKSIINNTNDLICSIDRNYNLIEFNSALAQFVKNGYALELRQGMAILDFIHPKKHAHLKEIYDKVLNGETSYDVQSYSLRSGTDIFVETSYHPIYTFDDKISGISIFSKDVTERIKNEQKITIALKEKDVLLAEIHHRIKNNLAMVSSMLQLKEMNIGNIEAKEVLKSSRERIKTTAIIHELLYRNETFHDINIKDFVSELFNLLKINDSIELALNGDDVALNLTTMLPLGLILNEIMMNSFKYSYTNCKAGRTSVSISSNEKTLTIEYCDCQGAFPETIDFYNHNSTGLTLIHTFIEQLNGQIKLVSNIPPKYEIQIPLNEQH